MVNWKKLFEEDYEELEERPNSKDTKKTKLGEASLDKDDHYTASEKTSDRLEEKKKSRLRFEEDDLEDYYEEDDYQLALEEELSLAAERAKNSRSFFKKKEKELVEDAYEEEFYEELEEDFELEEDKNRKSAFSFFTKKSDKKEDLYKDVYDNYEDDVYADLEEELGLRERSEVKKERKSSFSFFDKKSDKKEDLYQEVYDDYEDDIYADLEEELGLRERSEVKKERKLSFSFFNKKSDKEEILEEKQVPVYGEYDADLYTDLEEDIYDDYEESFDLEEKDEKKKGFSFASLKERFIGNDRDESTEEYTYEEDLYEEEQSTISEVSDKEEIYDYEESFDLEEKDEKKKGFSFASLKERFIGNDRDGSTEEYTYEEDLYKEEQSTISEVSAKEEVYDDLENDYEVEEKEAASKESLFNKIRVLFKSKDKLSEEEAYDEYLDDEAEDYKTYLERQKLESKQEEQEEYYESDLDEAYEYYEDYYEEDFDLNDERSSLPSKSFFARIKEKFNNFKSSRKDESEFEYKYDQEELEFEDLQEERIFEKSSFLGNFINKNESDEDEYEYDYIEDEEQSISDKLGLVEEKEILPDEEENVSLQESLRSFGIETNQIQSVDVFEERNPREERERRVHPTLASVKVRRILQEKEIDSITYDLSLSNDKESFAKSLEKNIQEKLVETNIQEPHQSKNKEEIDKLNQDFNRIDRKQDKISNTDNFLKDRDGEKIESAVNSIKSTQEEINRDLRDYAIEVEESEGAPVRRSKLAYTSVDDVLSGKEDVLETDIERKKHEIVSDEPHPEEIENFRKDLFKDRSSEDLVSSRDRSNLDELILDTKIVEKSNEKELEEITMLEENLELIKEDRFREKNSEILEDDLSKGFEEISIEQVARDSEYNFESYEDLKVSERQETPYPDYYLDAEEIDELESQNEIEYKSDQVDIESLNREMKQKKIDEYRSQYWGLNKNNSSQEKTETRVIESAPISSTSTTAAYDYSRQQSMAKKFQAEKTRGIEYEEKLYTNDVGDYFVTEDAPLTFGEYKTQDRGYRPVSKTDIELKQKQLDAIFDKYSNVKIPRKNTTEYVQQKISGPVRVDKYKPSQVVSAIYGTSKPTEVKIAKDVKAASAVASSKAKNDYIKEIAKKEEHSWNLDLAPRATKNKKVKKKK
ncbi:MULTISPECIES: hypothetical protein [unclassified Gemella]|uniref:hypothetical protein n=1 Tax=unclassified Gemella TaxID=2624949 RepID=UPI0015D02B77|nr:MULTISPECIES: hypothetical protein [unclassified Gemella]MBF0709946.1 hypothetical protein [Gemella sp. GL1.1]NYS27290.1 hypothetical protein [Gemella sp. GL1]